MAGACGQHHHRYNRLLLDTVNTINSTSHDLITDDVVCQLDGKRWHFASPLLAIAMMAALFRRVLICQGQVGQAPERTLRLRMQMNSRQVGRSAQWDAGSRGNSSTCW